jgi:hypothetical protein
MAFYVVFKSKNAAGKQNYIEAHVPLKPLPQFENEEIDYIQADCDELDLIIDTFNSSIPTNSVPTIPLACRKRVHRWYGDIAKTIYFNLG